MNFLQILPPAFSKLNCQIQSKLMSSFGLSFDHRALKHHSWCICFHQKGFVQFSKKTPLPVPEITVLPAASPSRTAPCAVTCSDTARRGELAWTVNPSAGSLPRSPDNHSALAPRVYPTILAGKRSTFSPSKTQQGQLLRRRVLKLTKDPAGSEKQQVPHSSLGIP